METKKGGERYEADICITDGNSRMDGVGDWEQIFNRSMGSMGMYVGDGTALGMSGVYPMAGTWRGTEKGEETAADKPEDGGRRETQGVP